MGLLHLLQAFISLLKECTWQPIRSLKHMPVLTIIMMTTFGQNKEEKLASLLTQTGWNL